MVNNSEDTTNNKKELKENKESQQKKISIQISRRSIRLNKDQRSLNLTEMTFNAYINLIKNLEKSKLDIQEPKSYKEVTNSQEKELWLNSIRIKLKTLEKNNT